MAEANTSNHFFMYARRKTIKFFGEKLSKIDLGVYTLKEVVQLCLHKRIISDEAFLNFTTEICLNEE